MDINPADPFHLQVRAARRAAHWSQAFLAEKAGCRQSQLSAFETGLTGKVSREAMAKFAELLGLKLPEPGTAAAPVVPAVSTLAFCPNFECPSNLPYFVGGELYFLPLGTAGAGTHCALCGEVLERACPSCGAPVHARGGCCGACGASLLSLPEGFTADLRVWAEARRTDAVALRAAVMRNGEVFG